MTTTITTQNGIDLQVCHLGVSIVDHEEQTETWARLTPGQRAELAAALSEPTTGGPIDPEECDRTTVYTGECRNLSDTEWIRFESGRRRSPDTRDGNTWLIDVAHGSRWVGDDQVRNLVPLVPAPAVTRDDQGGVRGAESLLRQAERARDGAVARAEVAEKERDEAQMEHADALRERDEAVARAEQAENARDTAATRAEQLERKATASARSEADLRTENADLRTENADLVRRRDEWKARAEQAERGLALAHNDLRREREERILDVAPAVARADIEKVLRESTNRVFQDEAYPHMTDAVCDLLGIEPEAAVDPVEAEVAMAWAEYRKDYQPNPADLTAAHKAFTSGYQAARHVLGQEADQ